MKELMVSYAKMMKNYVEVTKEDILSNTTAGIVGGCDWIISAEPTTVEVYEISEDLCKLYTPKQGARTYIGGFRFILDQAYVFATREPDRITICAIKECTNNMDKLLNNLSAATDDYEMILAKKALDITFDSWVRDMNFAIVLLGCGRHAVWCNIWDDEFEIPIYARYQGKLMERFDTYDN